MWYGAIWLGFVLAVGSAVARQAWLMGALCVLLVVAQLLAALDTLRLSRPQPLPRARWVILLFVGLLGLQQLWSAVSRGYVAEAFQIPSGSMIPTLAVGEHIMTVKLGQTMGRGDVVVFRYPRDPEVMYIKRIVAMGGDTVEERDGQLIVNGQAVARELLDEPCSLPDGESCTAWRETLDGHPYKVVRLARAAAFGPVEIPADHVFVMGDNRDNSNDSRVWGPMPANMVVAKAAFIWWSRGEQGMRWDRMGKPVE
jgi:signal peptidase I